MSAILLTQINVWLDVVFTTVIVAAAIGILGHGLGNTLVGRFKKRFVDWQWPAHEGPPIPFLPKFMHLQHLTCMFLLGISGMYIRFPFFDGGRSFMRWVHYGAMIVVTFNIFWRLWYAFASRQRDYREFSIGRKDIVSVPGVLAYYLFLRPEKPHVAKYNIMQKVTYVTFLPLMLLQAFTGFSLLTAPEIMGFAPRDVLVGWWLGPLLGGTALAGAWVRVAHYTVNWLFILLTFIHMYMALSENFAGFLDFFMIRTYDEQHGHGDGHDGHGDGHDGHEHGADEEDHGIPANEPSGPAPAFAEAVE